MEITQEFINRKETKFALRPATMDDVDAVVALVNATGVDQVGRPLTNVQDILNDWNMPAFKLDKATRVAEMPDGHIAGYIEVWDTDPVPVQNWVWACVDPRYEGQGVGSALMDWADKRLQQTVSRVPDDAKVTYLSAAVSTHFPSKELFEDRDMEFVRRFWHMMIEFNGPPPDAVWPSPIQLSSFAVKEDLRAIIRVDEEIFRDHWGHVRQPEDELVKEARDWIDSQSDFDPSLWFLAMDGEDIAGICLCKRTRIEYPGAAWINVLGVRRPWRKQGLGLALLHHAFGIFYREGKKGVGLGVDSSNLTGATRLYEKAGMSVVKQDDAYEKEIRSGHELSKR